MCGRYQLDLPGRTIAAMFGAELAPRLDGVDVRTWNAAPTNELPVVALGRDGHRVVDAARWGLVPSWERSQAAAGARRSPNLINARVESVLDKPAYRRAVRRGRVLVPATGFYEWHGDPGRKIPWSLRVRDCAGFAMAGIAEEWQREDGLTELSYAILTTRPNELAARVHDRMPVLLDDSQADAWLETMPEQVDQLVRDITEPFAADRMESWPVSTDVNAVANDGPALVERVEFTEVEPPTLF